MMSWQAGAISRDNLLHNFRTGGQKIDFIRNEPPPSNVTLTAQPARA
jgi:hypothetical protein